MVSPNPPPTPPLYVCVTCANATKLQYSSYCDFINGILTGASWHEFHITCVCYDMYIAVWNDPPCGFCTPLYMYIYAALCSEIINLDVSTLVAWSSLMIRGGAQYKYEVCVCVCVSMWVGGGLCTSYRCLLCVCVCVCAVDQGCASPKGLPRACSHVCIWHCDLINCKPLFHPPSSLDPPHCYFAVHVNSLPCTAI